MTRKTPNTALEDRGLLYVGNRDDVPAEEIVGAMDLTGEEAGLRQAWRVFDSMRQIPLLAPGDSGHYRLTPEGLERAGILALIEEERRQERERERLDDEQEDNDERDDY